MLTSSYSPGLTQHKRLEQNDGVLPAVAALVNLAMVAAHEQGVLGQIEGGRDLAQ